MKHFILLESFERFSVSFTHWPQHASFFFYIPYRTRVNWIEKSKAKKYVLDKNQCNFSFFLTFALSLVFARFLCYQIMATPSNQPTSQMHKNMKMLNVLWSMHMCDCFIYAMIAFATYLLKVRADAIRLAGTKRTPHTYTAWLLIRFDSISFISWTTTTATKVQNKNKKK